MRTISERFEKLGKLLYKEYQQSGMILNQVHLYLSIGSPDKRAFVYHQRGNTFLHAISSMRNKIQQLERHSTLRHAEWLKLDLAVNIQKSSMKELLMNFGQTKKHYFRKGVSFDKQFSFSFLEQEINSNSMIQKSKTNVISINDKNINHYCHDSRSLKSHLPFSSGHLRNVYTFDTIGVFCDGQRCMLLHSSGNENGIRKWEGYHESILFVEQSSAYLHTQIRKNGAFNYGKFAAFARDIPHYNNLRHASTLYSMIEAYDTLNRQNQKLAGAIYSGLEYMLRETCIESDHGNFIIETTADNEIKLGANAAAVLALTKWISVTGDQALLQAAQKLGDGILFMQNEQSGSFVHVLNDNDLSVKEERRIVYYDGEAVFALLRLHHVTKEEKYLAAAKKAFDYFIKKEYWTYHDHWLSYAVNELTAIEPDDRYFVFGLKNVSSKLDFIYHRATTYPTFLELTMAAWHMVKRIRELDKDYLLKDFDEEALKKTIHKRAYYQRTGFFYPEIAMYMKKPYAVLGSFFIKHHSFRVRIDDIEHNISGYCEFIKEFLDHQSVSAQRSEVTV